MAKLAWLCQFFMQNVNVDLSPNTLALVSLSFSDDFSLNRTLISDQTEESNWQFIVAGRQKNH